MSSRATHRGLAPTSTTPGGTSTAPQGTATAPTGTHVGGYGDAAKRPHRDVTSAAPPEDLILPKRSAAVIGAAAMLGATWLFGCGGTRGDVVVEPLQGVETAAAGTGSALPVAPTRVAFEIPRDGKALELARTPWPSELFRLADGHLDVRGYPGHDSAILREYLARAAEDLDGFSIAPVVFFHFDGPLDLDAIPREDTSRSADATIALVDVDARSPERGTFYPLALRATSRDMRYVRKGTLAVAPLAGFVLRPDTLYAAVVRRSFGGAPGGLVTSLDLEAVLAKTARADPAGEGARALHAPAVEALEGLGIARADIASLAVFRTGRPHALVTKLLDALDGMFATGAQATTTQAATTQAATTQATTTQATTTQATTTQATTTQATTAKSVPKKVGANKGAAKKALSVEEGARRAPRILQAEWDPDLSKAGLYRVIRGAYCTPNFQAHPENAPFLENEGGRVLTDHEGRPLVAPVPKDAAFASTECPGQIRARFFLSIPESAPPKSGVPLLVTAHGTGGSATTFLGTNDFAGWAAREGYAAVSTDQPLNGGAASGRPGAAGPLVLPLGIPVPPGEGGPPLAFYNPLYPGAARGNMQQAQADAAVLVRLFGGLDLGALRRDDGKAVLKAVKGQTAPPLDASRIVLAGHSQGCQSIAALGALETRARAVILSGCGGDVRIGILRRRVMNLTGWISLLLGLDPEEPSELHPLLSLVQNLADPIDPLAFARHYWDPLPGHNAQKVLHFEGLHDGYNPDAASEALAVALHVTPASPLVRPIPGLSLLAATPSSDRRIAQVAPTQGEDGHFVLYHEQAASEAFRGFLRSAAP